MIEQTNCPAASALKSLLDGVLPPAEEGALGTHLEGCPRCQESLQELAAGGTSWAGLARHLSSTPPPPEAALRDALAHIATPSNAVETQLEAGGNNELSLDFLDPPSEPGHLGRLDTYEILEIIGRGGMGVVLKAFEPSLNRLVAIKILSPHLAGQPSARKRFLREGRAAAGLNHENIVTIHAISEIKGLPYLVMQYVAGASLEERLNEGPLPLAETVRIAAATARGLEAAHAQGMVHRDVKPANILLENGSGRVKLTDFGLVRAVDDTRLTQSGVIVGTPQYMAPEQASGAAVDPRADLFSLGSVLYALCTGRPPFEAETLLAVLRRVADETPRPVREINESIPRWLAAIIARLHAKNPSERFQSAAEVADLLERHFAQLQISTAPSAVPCSIPIVEPLPLLPRRTRRHVLLALTAFLVLAALGAAGFAIGRKWIRPRLAPQDDTRAAASEEASASEHNDLARKVQHMLATHCYRCHGEDGAVEGGFNYLMDRDRLVARKKIRPGQPDKSRLLRRVAEGEMPPEGEKPRPGPEDIALLQRWIAAGAPAFAPSPASRTFVAVAEVSQSIRDDLAKRKERDRRFTRYFTLTHLFNSGLSEDELQSYRNGLSKLLNSLSWKKAIVVPVTIDAAKTVLRIDLRDYGWTDTEWEALLAVYPYGSDDPSPEHREEAASTGTALAHLRGDWFVAHASRPPLYHQLLQLPRNERELEKLLHLNVEANIRSEQVARAGFNDSGVSRNNRLIERHDTSYGAYWKSYDFSKNTGEQNLFERPLGPGSDDRSFRHAGGEIIFNLPNGLQGYMLVNGNGARLDKGPTEIVSDPKRPDRAVENGLSCMSCHSRGLNPKSDKVRAVVEAAPNAFPKEERDAILALYPPADMFADLVRKDIARFQKAAAATGAKVGATEPIMALAAQFEAPLDLRRAAAEVGMRPSDFLTKLEDRPEIARTIAALKLPGGSVPRETFARLFAQMIEEWKLGVPNTLPSGKPLAAEPRPAHASPNIPEPKLPGGKVEFKLPEAFARVRSGGGGRYLIFHLKKAKKLAIFDVAQTKIVHEVEVPDDVVYAAGRDKLLIVVPGQRLLQRWDLHGGKREKTVPIADDRPIRLAVMGCNSEGPLMLWSDGKVQLWDAARMEPLAVERLILRGGPHWGFELRVSADGQTFLGWTSGISGQHYAVMHLHNREAINLGSPDGHSFNGHWATPSADGSLVFRSSAGIYDGADMKILASDSFKGAVLLPTEDPRFFLSVRVESRDTNTISLCTSADRLPVFTVKGIEKVTGSMINSQWGYVNGEPRIHYLPSANVLVNLPESNDRIVVRSLNLLEALNQSGQDYLFVLSRPDRHVAAGAVFTYRIDVKSKAGSPRYKIESGPEGMTVSSAGVVRWRVPERPDSRLVRVILTIRSASGKEVQHAFDLTVTGAP